MPKIIQGKFKILSNKKIEADYFKMAICAPEIAQQAKPGQFVHLRCQNNIEPLLRRPFSFHRLNHDNFEILYKIVGRGTKLLAKKQKGDKIDILGPLGNGFSLPAVACKLRCILIAGGMGIAPLVALAERLAGRLNEIIVLLGARNKKKILCAADFKRLGAKVCVATDNGSQGFKGFVTSLLKKILRTRDEGRGTTIYACGPKAMLKETALISQHSGIAAYGSLEENMACGLGACLGCAINTAKGYQRVCKDGPVFNLREIKWQK